jgi:hypothetical protein
LLWLLGVLAAVGVLTLPLMLAYAGEDEQGTPILPTTTAEQPPLVESTPVDLAKLEVNNQDLFPLLGGSLRSVANFQVKGASVPVISVVKGDVFWVGRKGQQLLVRVNLKSEPPPKVKAGQLADFVGPLRKNPEGGPQTLGVSEADSAEVLSLQGYHAWVSIGDLTLH